MSQNSQNQDTRMGGDLARFRSTLWTIVIQAKDPSAPGRREALEVLIAEYWKPAYFFIRRRGNDVESSKDIVQGFFAALLEKNYLQYVQRGAGKFRTFLLAALEHYMADEFDRRNAQKRGGGKVPISFDIIGAESQLASLTGSEETPDRRFERDWAVRVMAQGLLVVRTNYEESGRAAEFEAFRKHLTEGGGGAPSYAEIGRTVGLSEDEVRKRIHRFKGDYRDAILEVVRSYTERDEEVHEEVRDLFSAWS
jgi:DNA-directed RNA polymerase specialized sigma24 family protein